MSRGGAAGGRGGRGRGGGGKPSVFTPQLLGHLNFQDIINQSKEGTDILYPPMDVPNTDFPSDLESSIARRYNTMSAEMKFTPYWIDAPVKASTDIERYSDRFKLVKASATGAPTPAFASLHTKRRLDKELLPTAAFEAVFERKKRVKQAADGTSRKKLKSAKDLTEGAEGREDKDDDSEEELEEDVDDGENEEELEDENDYGDNYFDNGEDDGGEGGDALGGGGDEDGGVFD